MRIDVQAGGGIRGGQESRGLGDEDERQGEADGEGGNTSNIAVADERDAAATKAGRTSKAQTRWAWTTPRSSSNQGRRRATGSGHGDRTYTCLLNTSDADDEEDTEALRRTCRVANDNATMKYHVR